MLRIFIKSFLLLLGLALICGGGYLAAAGYAHSNPQKVYTPKIPVPHSKEIAQFTRKQLLHVSPEVRDHMRVDTYALLVPLAAAGLLLALIGLICMLNALLRFKYDPQKDPKKMAALKQAATKSASRISPDTIKGINPQQQDSYDGFDDFNTPAASTGTGETISFDESMLDVEEDPFEALRDVNNLVTMSQAYIEPADSERIISMFRSDLLPYVNTVMDSSSMNRMAHQILESVIFRHKRQQEDITADQFQQQDKRVYESETETFLRRYMPSPEKINSAEMQECAGKTYDLVAQGAIQKKFLSESEDWKDISLRNAADVLAEPTPESFSMSSDF